MMSDPTEMFSMGVGLVGWWGYIIRCSFSEVVGGLLAACQWGSWVIARAALLRAS
nr:MAG TPA: hypothetical protein [Caudoviricetes sp.]